jgi:bifunctional non-homologous end joining protein LigD
MARDSSAAKDAGLLPQHIDPMLAVASPEPFDAPDKLFEIKWDGIRALAFIEGGAVRIHTRGMKNISEPFADVGEALLEAVHGDGVVLDGELIAIDDEGVPRLHRVMERWHQGTRTRKRVQVSFEVFDILYRDGRSLMREPLYRRKMHLNDTVEPNALVHVCHYEEGEGIALFDAARDLGLEGIVAKDKQSVYQPGKRSRHWLKIKHSRTANLVIAGYTFGGGARKELFGSLLLGAYDGGKMWYVGSVGGGFSKQDLEFTYAAITQLHTDESPFVEDPRVEKLLFWCEPVLAVQVNYGEFTEQRHLRFPIFSALRPDVDPHDCTLEAIGEGL